MLCPGESYVNANGKSRVKLEKMSERMNQKLIFERKSHVRFRDNCDTNDGRIIKYFNFLSSNTINQSYKL